MLRLSLRVLPLFATIVGLAMALGAYMNFSGVRGAYLDLIESRMQLVADEVGTVVEVAVSVGIAASEQVTLPGLLARQASADRLIGSIDLIGPSGTVLFSSDPARAGQAAPADRRDIATVDRAIVNDFGVTVAHVRVRYDTDRPGQAIGGFGHAVLIDAVPIGVGALVAGSLAALIILSLLHRHAVRATGPYSGDPVTQAAAEIDAATGGGGGVGR